MLNDNSYTDCTEMSKVLPKYEKVHSMKCSNISVCKLLFKGALI